MTSTQLRRTILRRAVRPYALAVLLSLCVITFAMSANIAAGQLLDEFAGDVVGLIALAAVAALWGGWWLRSDAWMTRGLLWSAVAWSGVAGVLTVEGGSWVSAALAWCWVLASGGAWLLEHDEVKRSRGGR